METIRVRDYDNLRRDLRIRELESRLSAAESEISMQNKRVEEAEMRYTSLFHDVSDMVPNSDDGDFIHVNRLVSMTDGQLKEYARRNRRAILETRMIASNFNHSFVQVLEWLLKRRFENYLTPDNPDAETLTEKSYSDIRDAMWNGIGWYDRDEWKYWNFGCVIRMLEIRPGSVSFSGFLQGIGIDNHAMLWHRMLVLELLEKRGMEQRGYTGNSISRVKITGSFE